MQYPNVEQAIFLSRPNRFLAYVQRAGNKEVVHVKNTGRCRELLVPGAEVYLTAPGTPGRKTTYDLVAVRKENGLLVNMDSQAPNAVAREWLGTQGFSAITPEYRYGASRIDFCMEKSKEKYLMEVKGCTLEVDGVGYFPDAPTERGTRHLRTLARAVGEGYRAWVAFVIQMDGVLQVHPNRATDPAFCQAYEEALAAGVEVHFLLCHVEPDGLTVTGAVTGGRGL